MTIDGYPQSITLMGTGLEWETFEFREDTYVSTFEPKAILEFVGGDIVISGRDLTRWNFYGQRSGPLTGKVKRWTSPGNLVAVAGYDQQGFICSVEQFDPGSSDLMELHYHVQKDGPDAGLLMEVVKQHHSAAGSEEKWRIGFEYYRAGNRHGSARDLKLVNVQHGGTRGVDRTYYRYYTGEGDGGFVHGLQLEVPPSACDQADECGIAIEEAREEVLLRFGARSFAYDPQRRLSAYATAQVQCRYEHLLSDGSPRRNWNRRSRAIAEGTEETTYFDVSNRALLRVRRHVDYSDSQEVWELDARANALRKLSAAEIEFLREPEHPWENFHLIRTAVPRTESASLIENAPYGEEIA